MSTANVEANVSVRQRGAADMLCRRVVVSM